MNELIFGKGAFDLKKHKNRIPYFFSFKIKKRKK
jgi:hypothetical protein